MVSLPHIVQGGGQHFPGDGSSSGNSESNISTLFCYDCTDDLSLPVRRINRNVLREYEEKCAQIRNMQRLLYQKETTFEDNNEFPTPLDVNQSSTFQISNKSKETLQVYAFGFPLLQQSRLLPPESDGFNLEQLRNKILKRQSRCNILNKTPQLRFGENKLQSKYVRNKVRRLPSIKSQKWERYKSCSRVERASPPPQKILSADPEVVVFESFEVGGYYEKRCKITNVSTGKCRFQIIPFDNMSQFRVIYSKATNALAAGLSCYVTIQFFCRSVADTEDHFIVRAKDGEDLVVLIKAESEPPCLIEANDNICNLDEVVDSLIDCGSHFVGEKSKIILTLRNIGSAARFCFITESEWVDLEFSIDSSNTLLADPFRIQPMYFSLKKDQEITISITTVPPSDGLHTTSVLLLCENGTLNHIDLVCDGYLFEPSLIDHLDMLKTFDVDNQDIVFAECYLDVGQMLTFERRYVCFFIYNTANVNMSYHWELRRVSLPKIEPLPETALSIVPMRGRLAPRLAEIFCLKVNTDCVPPGVYRTVLVLVIDDLPKKCVPLNYCDQLLLSNEEDDKDLRSIEAKYIELWMECVSPSILLSPYVIDFTDFPLIYGSTIEKREIIIKNESPGAFALTWKCFDECSTIRGSIEPSFIECDIYSTHVCTLSVEAIQEGPFELSFWCISSKGDAKVELLVKGYCCKPQLTSLTDSVDFGLVKIESNQNTAIVAKNCSTSDSFQWTLEELFFRSSVEGIVTLSDAPTSLSTNGGKICHKNSEVLVRYQLKCQEDTLWCSVLDWDGNFIPVTADIQAPDISLSTYTLSADPLYLSVPLLMRVTVSNHSLISAAVFWGCSTDESLETVVTVEVVPKCFVLEPEGHEVVELRVTPHEKGPLENLYIPCFVEGNPQPLLLKIEGNVEGLKVRVEWDAKDHHCCVILPPPERGISEAGDDLLEKTECTCPPNSPKVSQLSLDVNCDIFPINSNFTLAIDTTHKESEVSSTSNDFGVHNQETIGEDDNISIASTIPYVNWPIVGGHYTRDLMDEKWERHFNNLFLLEELSRETNDENIMDSPVDRNSLCFHDIPIRKAITQIIYIRNDTDILSTYDASVVYNFERVDKPDKPPDPDALLRKIKDKYDEYVDRANPRRGLTVFITPETGELPPHDYVMISVTVVALTWGHYSDMIVLQVGDLNHLCVRLNVSVTQPPIIAPQVIGFGSLAHRSPPVSRYFKLENVSTVSVYVCWDIFTSSPDKFPFNVMLFDGDPFQLQLTDYYGSNSSPYFQIKEKYSILESNSSKIIEVTFHPHLVNLDVDNQKLISTLKAALIGHIYLTDKDRLAANNEKCNRDDGSKLPPLQVDLEVHVEVPFLSLLNVFNYQLSFKCTAYDVMNSKNKIWNSENVVRVQNNTRTNLEAKVYTVGYFYVTKIEYPCAEKKSKYSKYSIQLRPGESCEVTLVCEVKESDLLDCFEPDSENLDEEAIGMCSIEKGLLCFEQKDIRQDVKLELWLYPPLLHFSENSLNFGTVYIGDTKRLIINIAAPINEEYFEAKIKSGSNSPFFLNKTSGTLKAKMGDLLQVFFCPKECTFYQDVLVVRSCLEKMFREIPLTGIGTFDYRAHTY